MEEVSFLRVLSSFFRRFLDDHSKSTFNECCKGLVNILARCSWCFKVNEFICHCKVLCHLLFNLTNLNKITFVAEEHYSYVVLSVVFKLVQPLLNVFKSLRLSEIECDNSSDCTPIISICYGSESLLPGSVPYLVFYYFVLKVDRFCCELYSYRWLGVYCEGVFYEPGQKVCFTYAWVSNHHDFIKEIELFLTWHYTYYSNYLFIKSFILLLLFIIILRRIICLFYYHPRLLNNYKWKQLKIYI